MISVPQPIIGVPETTLAWPILIPLAITQSSILPAAHSLEHSPAKHAPLIITGASLQ